MREGGAGSMHLSEQVRLDDGSEDVGGYVFEAPVDDYPGAVDPDVQPTEAIDRAPGQLGYLCFLTDVGRKPQGFGPARVAFVRDLLERWLRARGERQSRAASREGQRGGTSDSARGAGDHHDAIAQVASHAVARTLARTG
jgi:hypothetical protein